MNSTGKSGKSTPSRKTQRSDPRKIKAEERYNEIIKLRSDKKSAIKRGDYINAEDIDSQISKKNEEFTKFSQKLQVEEYKERLREMIASYKEAIEKSDNSWHQEEREFREKINAEFEEIQQKQRCELLDIGTEHEKARLRERERRVGKAEELRQQAEHSAMIGNYEQAKNLSKEADAVSQEIIKERLDSLDSEFEENSRRLIRQQKDKIIFLVQKLQKGIKDCEEKHNNRNKLLNENFEASVTGHYNRKGKNSKNIEALTVKECRDNKVPEPKALGQSYSVKKCMAKAIQEQK